MPSHRLLFIPAYNCAAQITRVLDQLREPWVRQSVDAVLVVDNRSTDATASAVAGHDLVNGDGWISLVRNDSNYGLGGSHKVAFDYARANGFDELVVLHGDDQGTLADFRTVFTSGLGGSEAVLGSRFMPGSVTPGYSPVRIAGNHAFNLLYSFCLRHGVRDLGAGLNLYSVPALARLPYHHCSDDLTFNCTLLAMQALSGQKVDFVPISWREDDQVSNVKLMRQVPRTFAIAWNALTAPKAFLTRDHSTNPVAAYSWTRLK